MSPRLTEGESEERKETERARLHDKKTKCKEEGVRKERLTFKQRIMRWRRGRRSKHKDCDDNKMMQRTETAFMCITKLSRTSCQYVYPASSSDHS